VEEQRHDQRVGSPYTGTVNETISRAWNASSQRLRLALLAGIIDLPLRMARTSWYAGLVMKRVRAASMSESGRGRGPGLARGVATLGRRGEVDARGGDGGEEAEAAGVAVEERKQLEAPSFDALLKSSLLTSPSLPRTL
jgi:hypothetical protein